MVKTRRQAASLIVKEEADNDKSKLTQLLHGSESSDIKNPETRESKRVSAPINEIKQEDTHNKTALYSPSSTEEVKEPWITKQQIKKLIDYIIKDKLTAKEAAREVGMCYASALHYYRDYRNDHKHRIPLPRVVRQIPGKTFTSEQIKQLIGYIINDKMRISLAAKKVNMSNTTARKYFLMYKQDPEHHIPEPGVPKRTSAIETSTKRPTADQVKELIDYVVSKKMTITAASKKLGISRAAAFKYYNRYLNDPERKIPAPDKGTRIITNDQVRTLIRCIVNDNLSITAAARKANMSQTTGKIYYQKFLNDPKGCYRDKQTTHRTENDRLKELIGLIFNDKLKVKEAAKKVGMSRGIAFKHYYRYIDDPSQYDFIPQVIFKDTNVRYQFSDRLKNLFEYIVDDKMSITDAAKKANVARTTAARYYKAYLNDPERKIPKQTRLGLSKDKVKKVISYIVHDKLSIGDAAKKANVCYGTTQVYYSKYKDYLNRLRSGSLDSKQTDEVPEDLFQTFVEIGQKRKAPEKAKSSHSDPAVKVEPLEYKLSKKRLLRSCKAKNEI